MLELLTFALLQIATFTADFSPTGATPNDQTNAATAAPAEHGGGGWVGVDGEDHGGGGWVGK